MNDEISEPDKVAKELLHVAYYAVRTTECADENDFARMAREKYLVARKEAEEDDRQRALRMGER